MYRTTRPFLLIVALLVLGALLVQACAAPADPPAAAQPTPAVEESTGDDTAEETEAEPTPEAVATVQESQASQSADLRGVTVTSDEDVTTPRDAALFGGQYCSSAASDAVSFHPYLTTDTASSAYQASVYSGALLRLDEDTLEYIPNMAESYSVSEDGLTFTFNLRKDMKWSDGQPLTAQDFKWTYDQVTNPDNAFPYLSQLEFITSYEALDDYTLEIKIGEVYAPALGQMSGLITPLPKHVWENLPWDDPEQNPEINQPSVVSGPYKVKEWTRDQRIIFEANENYWYRGAPSIAESLTEIVPDTDISYQMMVSGECDTGTITPEQLEEARQLENVTVYEWWPAAASWTYIGLNMREGFVTNDINVRHGLSYAIDKDLLTDEIMLGQAKRQCSVFPETSWVYNPDVPCYDYNPEQAIAEFEEAGYTYDGERMLDADGNPLTLRLIYGPNTNPVRELIAVTVQDYLSEIGIETEIQALEWSAFLDAIHSTEPDWDLYIGAWRSTIEPHIMYTIWAEESIPDLNSVAYVNKEVEQLFEEGGATYDNNVRKEKYGEVQRIIAEEAPYIFLYYQKAWSGQNNRVKGIIPKPLGIGWNSDDWYLQEDPGQ
jgi:peptide/nickel transport system substrate-binding protein